MLQYIIKIKQKTKTTTEYPTFFLFCETIKFLLKTFNLNLKKGLIFWIVKQWEKHARGIMVKMTLLFSNI